MDVIVQLGDEPVRRVTASGSEGYRWTLRNQDTTVLLVVAGVIAGAVLSQLPVLRRMRRSDVANIVRERSLC